MRAQLALAEGDPGAALAVLRSTDGLDTVERRTLAALALEATGAHAEAAAAMEGALALAEATGHRWPFALPPAARDILHACIRAGTSHRAIAGELLEAIDDREPAGEPADVPLTSREHEILRLLATTVDTSGIAAELGVSRNTVKTHLRSIYMKLDATDRRGAVTRARELHLLRHDER